LVTKPVGESGGYGIVIGPHASEAELEKSRKKIMDDPDNFISQANSSTWTSMSR
jgi:uncharacterized circularly permuted ATP-grasp superfamily protein